MALTQSQLQSNLDAVTNCINGSDGSTVTAASVIASGVSSQQSFVNSLNACRFQCETLLAQLGVGRVPQPADGNLY